jgi:hypothetical protein
LLTNGHLTLTEGHYRVTPYGRRTARSGKILKRLLGVGDGG